jgi:hypothetical protein
MNKQLTDQEIEKWRRILVGKFGPYAFVMTKEQIQGLCDKMQGRVKKSSYPTVVGRESLDDNPASGGR